MDILIVPFILYLIIGVNCIIVEPSQFYHDHSLNLPGMIIYVILWPLFLIMDRHNFSAGLVYLSHEAFSRCEEKEICVQRTQPTISH